jgi:excisionase family DNA binding protein
MQQSKHAENTRADGAQHIQTKTSYTSLATGNGGRKRQRRRLESMSESIVFPKMLTVAEAAQQSGLAVYRVRALCASGRVRNVRAGRKVLVNAGSLAAYMEQGDAPAAQAAGIRRIEG